MNDNLARVPVPFQEDYDQLYQHQLERTKQKQKQKKRSFAGSVIAVGIMFALAFCMTSGYMRIYEMEREISQSKNDLAILRSTNDQKAISIENAMTLDELEYTARTRLGMNKPANNQIIYINIHTEDSSHVIE